MNSTIRTHDISKPYDNPDEGRDMKDSLSHIGNLISGLASDVGNLVTLQLDLLKVEMKESTRTLARDSTLVAAGAIIGLFAFGGLTASLIAFIAVWLPMSPAGAVATSALIVGLIYSGIAGALIFMGIQHLKKRGVTPQRSIGEIQKDKQLVKDIRE